MLCAGRSPHLVALRSFAAAVTRLLPAEMLWWQGSSLRLTTRTGDGVEQDLAQGLNLEQDLSAMEKFSGQKILPKATPAHDKYPPIHR